MDLGFRRAGVEVIAAYDNTPEMIETYNLNQGGASLLDLSACDFPELARRLGLCPGQLDILVGGPPCQGFTSAGARFWDDPRNQLVINYAEALACMLPRWFVMENVEGILTTAGGTYLYETVKKMTELGYSLTIEKVYLQEYGIPQRRKRVIIVGSHEGKAYRLPSPTTPASGSIYRKTSSTLRDAISDLESVTDEALDHVPCWESGIKLERIKALRPGQTMKDLPERLQHASFRRRANRRVMDGTPSERRGGAPSGLKRLIYDEPCLTITSAAPSEFVHPTQDRTLTLRECARVQTFPDSYAFCGSKAKRILQIGNAVPPAFAEQLASSIITCDLGPAGVQPPGIVHVELSKALATSPALARTEAMLATISHAGQPALFEREACR